MAASEEHESPAPGAPASSAAVAGPAPDAPVTIEPCPAERDPEAVAFLRRVFYDEFRFVPDPALDRDFEGLCAHYRRGRGELWIARAGRAIVATTAILDLGRGPGGDAELKRMFVDPAMRGRGIGKGLLDVAVAHARARGFDRIVLDSTRDMRAAVGLYRAAGFREIPDYNGNQRADIFMALTLHGGK
jgi:ribosomal protein S18 acetylase RimI-like enzyme